MSMAGRGFSGSYRYGYQGSEKDNEVSGEGNSYTTEFRQLDPRLGRWFSVDPVFKPWITPYASMDNNSINLNDPHGDTPPGNGVCTSCNQANVPATQQDDLGQYWVKDDDGEYYVYTEGEWLQTKYSLMWYYADYRIAGGTDTYKKWILEDDYDKYNKIVKTANYVATMKQYEKSLNEYIEIANSNKEKMRAVQQAVDQIRADIQTLEESNINPDITSDKDRFTLFLLGLATDEIEQLVPSFNPVDYNMQEGFVRATIEGKAVVVGGKVGPELAAGNTSEENGGLGNTDKQIASAFYASGGVSAADILQMKNGVGINIEIGFVLYTKGTVNNSVGTTFQTSIQKSISLFGSGITYKVTVDEVGKISVSAVIGIGLKGELKLGSTSIGGQATFKGRATIR